MSCPPRVSLWHQEVSTALAPLSKPQALGLALWSAGLALTGSGGISQIRALLALVVQQKEGTVAQRLREWELEARAARGDQRRDLEVTPCFAPVLRWIVQSLSGSSGQLTLALDATSRGKTASTLREKKVHERIGGNSPGEAGMPKRATPVILTGQEQEA